MTTSDVMERKNGTLGRMSRSLLLTIMLLVTIALTSLSLAPSAQAQEPTSPQAFHDAMRKLWEDHIIWTRLYIVSAAADLPDADAVAQRLLQNQVDIGNAIRPYYGDEAADRLTQLLTDHITGAVTILTAAKGGDTAGMDTAVAAWQTNGADIAAFLNSANVDHWPLTDLQAAMQMHLDLTLQEAQAHLSGDFAQSIALYDQVHEHILVMADVLSNGIIAQFPDRFGMGGMTSEAPAGQTVDVSLTEFAIQMPTSIVGGTVTFNVTNNGAVEHNFEVEGNGLEEEFEMNLLPGETQSMTLDLAPGMYEVYCPVGDHKDQGMKLELTVTG